MMIAILHTSIIGNLVAPVYLGGVRNALRHAEQSEMNGGGNTEMHKETNRCISQVGRCAKTVDIAVGAPPPHRRGAETEKFSRTCLARR